MKRNVLLILACFCGALFTSIKAENICYDASESSAPDFWFTHMYYGTCTDYVASGSKLAGTTGRLDFNGGSSVIFSGIQVSEDGTYTLRLTYGIGWADATGAVLKLYVNDEFVSNCTFYPIAPAATATMDISVDLAANYDNVIKLTQQKDWPTVLGIQLFSGVTAVSTPEKEKAYSISVSNASISVRASNKGNNRIEVYSTNGQLIDSRAFNNSYTKAFSKGLYLVKVNGESNKILVR